MSADRPPPGFGHTQRTSKSRPTRPQLRKADTLSSKWRGGFLGSHSGKHQARHYQTSASPLELMHDLLPKSEQDGARVLTPVEPTSWERLAPWERIIHALPKGKTGRTGPRTADISVSSAQDKVGQEHAFQIVQGLCGEDPEDVAIVSKSNCGRSSFSTAPKGLRTLGACALRCLACQEECRYTIFPQQTNDCSLFRSFYLSRLVRDWSQVDQQCADKKRWCRVPSSWNGSCTKGYNVRLIRAQCPFTCGLCPRRPILHMLGNQSSRRPGPQQCVDQKRWCRQPSSWNGNCTTGRDMRHIQVQCPLTCGLCPQSYVQMPKSQLAATDATADKRHEIPRVPVSGESAGKFGIITLTLGLEYPRNCVDAIASQGWSTPYDHLVFLVMPRLASITSLHELSGLPLGMPKKVKLHNLSDFFASALPRRWQNSTFCRQYEGNITLGVLRFSGTPKYRAMFHFWFAEFESRLREYTYVLRIDADCILDAMQLDPFLRLPKSLTSPAKHGMEYPSLIDGMAIFFQQLNLLTNQATANYKNWRLWMSPYTSIMLINMTWLRSPRVRAVISLVNQTNCIYWARWGDVPLWGATMRLLDAPTSTFRLSHTKSSRKQVRTYVIGRVDSNRTQRSIKLAAEMGYMPILSPAVFKHAQPHRFPLDASRERLGEIGCALAHRDLWGTVITSGEDAIVFEDDIALSIAKEKARNMINETLHNLREKDLIYLGYWGNSNFMTSHAYFITTGGARLLRNNEAGLPEVPVDQYMRTMCETGRVTCGHAPDVPNSAQTEMRGVVKQVNARTAKGDRARFQEVNQQRN